MQNVVDLQRVGRRQSLVKPSRFISCWCEDYTTVFYAAISSLFLSKTL